MPTLQCRLERDAHVAPFSSTCVAHNNRDPEFEPATPSLRRPPRFAGFKLLDVLKGKRRGK